MLASLKGSKLGKGPLVIPIPGKKDSGEKTKLKSASHSSLIQKHSEMKDSLLSLSEDALGQRREDINSLRPTRSAPSVGSRAHKFQASLEIARQLREKTAGQVDNIAADFLNQTGSFWAELSRSGPAQVTYGKDGMVGASFNRMLEKWLLVFQDAESGADAFCDDFVMLFGLLPDDQSYCLLGKLLVDVMPGPCVLSHKSMTGSSETSFSAKALRSLNIFGRNDTVEKRLQSSTIVDTVCQALDYWLAVRPEDWATWEMALLWQNFVDKASAQYGPNVPEAILILDRHLRSPSWSFQFMDVNPREMAQQLTVLDHRLIKNVRMSEFRNCTWSKHANGQSTRLAPNILSAIIHANNVAVWVSAMVLNGNGVRQRARIIERFITISRHLRELRNYNTLMAIHSALTGLVVQRLTETVASIDGKHKAVLAKLTTLLSPEHNYACYRKELREQQALGGVVIPFLGLCLRDYTYVDVLESTLDSNQYNVKKMRMMGECLRPVWLLQRESVGQSDEAMEALISIMLQPRLSYEELVDISREMTSKGRELDHPPISKKRKPEDVTRPEEEKTPLLQGDAAVSVPSSVAIEMSTSPNARQELQRHIENLVTYIFSQFDENGDGNISRQEFEAVLSSFPFVDFELIDANNDNILSRQEVEDYFMMACFAELVFKKLDRDKSNAVTREEFNAMAEILPGVPFDFDDIDQDGNGTIQLDELRAAFFSAHNRHKISTSSLVPNDESPQMSAVGIAVDCTS